MAIENDLLTKTAKYSIKRIETKIFTLPSGIREKCLDNICLGNLPHRLILELIEHNSVNSSYNSSCFKFQHFNLCNIALYANGESVGKPMSRL